MSACAAAARQALLMTGARQRAVLLGAALRTVGVIALLLAGEREDPDIAWAVLGPIVMWSFVGTVLT